MTPRVITASNQDPSHENVARVTPALMSAKRLPDVAASDMQTSNQTNGELPKKKRINIGDRLKRIGNDIGKLGKSPSKSSASPQISKSTSSPASLTLTTVSPDPAPIAGPSRLPEPPPPILEDAPLDILTGDLDEKRPGEPEGLVGEPPEPSFLAQKIQALIDNLPLQPRSATVFKQSNLPPQGNDGRPVPPPGSAPIKDSKLIAFLSSATIMNGLGVKGRKSVWSVLESMGTPKHGPPPSAEDNAEAEHVEDIFVDNASVMVYSPLFPSQEDLVELADTVPFPTDNDCITNQEQDPVKDSVWTSVWPFSLWQNQPAEEQTLPSVLASQTTTEDHENKVSMPQRARVQSRAWVPSTNKFSVQVMWWGYRLYLPPPIMDILSDKTLEATKRASLITTALTWFFTNLPASALPPAIRPAIILLQQIAPFLGYIGTFISWSWSTIKSYDVGFGVVLTATWLMPVALIPGTWFEYDFPKSPASPSTIPLPVELTPSSPPPNHMITPALSSPTLVNPSTPSTIPTHTPLAHNFMQPAFMSPESRSPLTATPPIPASPGQLVPPAHNFAQPSLRDPESGSPLTPIPPVPESPKELVPIPPPPTISPVPIGSPLVPQLLLGPMLGTIPLPEVDDEPRTNKKRLFSRNKNKSTT